MHEQSESLNLSSVLDLVQDVIEGNFMEEFWVKAEIASFKMAGSGHCYLELVEKNEQSIVSRVNANLWKFQYKNIALQFLRETGKELGSDMKVLLKVKVVFHSVYGLSFTILGIDPSYTLGDIAAQRAKIINELKAKGLLELQQKLEFPFLPKRIAIISAENAAGFEDFVHQLKLNAYGYCFELEIFTAGVQGDRAEVELIQAFEKVAQRKSDFDCVAVVRGGGSALDLKVFDSYELCKCIAEFDLPVLTGIGHQRDEVIADLVAHESFKTPTAVATFLIDCFAEQDSILNSLGEKVNLAVKNKVLKEEADLRLLESGLDISVLKYSTEQKEQLTVLRNEIGVETRENLKSLQQEKQKILSSLEYLVQFAIKRESNASELFKKELKTMTLFSLKQSDNQLSFLIKNTNLLNPENLLKRGYVIVQNDKGEIVKRAKDIDAAKSKIDLELKFYDGDLQVVTKEH